MLALTIALLLQKGGGGYGGAERPGDKLKSFETLATEIPKARDAADGFTGNVVHEVMEPDADFAQTWEGTLVGRKGDLIVDLKTLRVRHTATTLTVIDVAKKRYREYAVDPEKLETWLAWSWLGLPVTAEAAKAYAVGVVYDGVSREDSKQARPGTGCH